MTESMKRARVEGDSTRARVRAVNPMGSPRNGLAEGRPYRHPGWVNGVPSKADNPPRPDAPGEHPYAEWPLVPDDPAAVHPYVQRVIDLALDDSDGEDDSEEAPTCPECDAPVASAGQTCAQCDFWANGSRP